MNHFPLKPSNESPEENDEILDLDENTLKRVREMIMTVQDVMSRFESIEKTLNCIAAS